MIENIGSINLDLSFYNGRDIYSDGIIEDQLLDIVKSHDSYEDVIANNNDWPILAHLSPERENIVGPMCIEPTHCVLEIGSGCGAVTGILAEKSKMVDCIELSKKRALISAYKNKKHDNITIYVGNFEDINLSKIYDVITLIGVFEYSALYINSENPFDEFLQKIKKLLKPGGALYIAIENKLGLKYFAGCVEDHTQRIFDSIEGYPSDRKIKTFSRSELVNLLTKNGYKDIYFYYPYPDYKLPQTIYSDDYLPKTGELTSPISNYDINRLVFFDEALALDSIALGDEFKIFSNSFLVEAISEGNI